MNKPKMTPTTASGFKQRRIVGSQLLGERLRRVREEAGFDLATAAQRLGISHHHLQAIEASAYDRLPGEVYIKNFLKRYAALLTINEDSVLAAFAEEYALAQRANPRLHQGTLPPTPPRRTFSVTPALLKRLSIGLLITAVLVYLGWEVSKIVAPPPLAVTSPVDNFITQENVVTIAGTTEAEAIVLINNQQTFVDQRGAFSETIVLEPGVNTITIAAKKQRSRERVIYRQVLYETTNQ